MREPSAYLVLEVPPEDLIRAIAEEDAVTDRDLDALEQRLASPALVVDAGRLAASALVVGRAGRLESRTALERCRRRLLELEMAREAQVLSLAIDLLSDPPPASVMRAESGYVHREPVSGRELFVEDPVAAHWHRRDRWGPPIRLERGRSPMLARGSGALERWWEHARQGEVLLVVFKPDRRVDPPEPPLFLAAAGLSRKSTSEIVRWPRVRSVGGSGQGDERRAAYETDQGVVELPRRSSIPADELIELMGRFARRAHG